MTASAASQELSTLDTSRRRFHEPGPDPVRSRRTRPDAYIVPLGPNQSRLGTGVFPPLETVPKAWRRPEKAAGAIVPPGKARELVAHISYIGPGTATMSTLEITYRQGDTEFVVTTYEALRLGAGKCRGAASLDAD